MKLILIRHAKAMESLKALFKNITDEERPLTKKARAKFLAFIKTNAKEFKDANLFVASEYLRAQQTLDVLLEGLNLKKQTKCRFITLPQITPDDTPQFLLKWLNERSEKVIVLISHEPFISNFLKQTIQLADRPDKVKKGSLIILEKVKERYDFIKLVNPKQSKPESKAQTPASIRPKRSKLAKYRQT